MINNIKNLLQNLQKNTNTVSPEVILSELAKLKTLIIASIIQNELKDIEGVYRQFAAVPEEKTEDSAKYLEYLSNNTTTSKDNTGNTLFLLHRPTQDMEYQQSVKDNTFTTKTDTDWCLDYMMGESSQIGENPVVSCWVDGKNIKPKSFQENTGTWGDLGANPHIKTATVCVSAGEHTIYQELRQRD